MCGCSESKASKQVGGSNQNVPGQSPSNPVIISKP